MKNKMETIELENVSKQELQKIKDKMCLFNITDGYISLTKGNLELFLTPCYKAKYSITLSKIENILDDTPKVDLK